MAALPVLSHVSVGTNDFPRAKQFYDAVLATLGLRCVMGFDQGAGYGREFPEFWVQLPHDGASANPGNGTHVCFGWRCSRAQRTTASRACARNTARTTTPPSCATWTATRSRRCAG